MNTGDEGSGRRSWEQSRMQIAGMCYHNDKPRMIRALPKWNMNVSGERSNEANNSF